MSGHGSVAKAVRLQKEKHPDQFCPNGRCLYRTGGGPCPKHRPPGVVVKLTDFDSISAAAIALTSRGVILGARGFSAGRWTPALRSSYAWSVLDIKGAPQVLCFDAFEAARWFCDFESGVLPPPPAEDAPIRIASDQEIEDERRLDAWAYGYQYSPIGGYGAGKR